MTWTPERDKVIQKMAAAGCRSEEIAHRLGCSKNAVIGRLHRLGGVLTARHTVWNKARMETLRKGYLNGWTDVALAAELGVSIAAVYARIERERSTAKREGREMWPRQGGQIKRPRPKAPQRPLQAIAIPPQLEAATPPGQKCTLMELRANSCRWPLGAMHDAVEFFCGAPVLDGHPYCVRHCGQAYRSAASIADARAA